MCLRPLITEGGMPLSSVPARPWTNVMAATPLPPTFEGGGRLLRAEVDFCGGGRILKAEV